TNVVPMADCHLQLWKYVPVNLGQVDEVAIGDEFHHRSPGTAKTMIGGQDLTYGAVEEDRLRRNVGMAGGVGTALRFVKRICLKKLIVSGEGFKRGRAPAKSARTTPAGHQHAALQSENRARAQTGKEDALDSQSGVADAAIPDTILVLKENRDIYLDLI